MSGTNGMPAPERHCLLIADISGYTSYLAGVELDHAQDVLADLLNTVSDALRPSFRLRSIEGDAAFVSAPADRIDGSTLMDTIERCYFDFRQRLLSIRQASVCECNACIRMPDLDLKVVAHHGAAAWNRVGQQEVLVGPDVILVHRLLKNDIAEATGVAAYAYLTQACIDATALDPRALGMAPHQESYDIGEVEGWVHDLGGAWTRERERNRVYIGPREATWSDAWPPIDAPVEVVWDALTSPRLRPEWQLGVTRVDIEADGGRIGAGARNHCMHGEGSFVEDILDWRPPRYQTIRPNLPGIGSFLMTHELEETPDGVVLHTRTTADRGRKGREAYPRIMELLAETSAPFGENFRQVAEREAARRAAAAGDAPEPELPAFDPSARQATAVTRAG